MLQSLEQQREGRSMGRGIAMSRGSRDGSSPVARGASPVARGTSPMTRGRSPMARGTSPGSRGRGPASSPGSLSPDPRAELYFGPGRHGRNHVSRRSGAPPGQGQRGPRTSLVDVTDQFKGKSGQEIKLLTNYFHVQRSAGWSLFEYNIKGFGPPLPENNLFLKKKVVQFFSDAIGPHVLNGDNLFTGAEILLQPDANDIIRVTLDDRFMDLKFSGRTEYGDPVYIQFYNIIIRTCLFGMGLEEIGRNFYDHEMKIEFPSMNIQLWPGYITSMRHHEEDVLLCVEVTHKVVRNENVLEVIQSIVREATKPSVVQDNLDAALKDFIVLTKYNRQPYRLVDVDFEASPKDTFQTAAGPVSFVEYYKRKYEIEIRDLDQPLLIASYKKWDYKQKVRVDCEVKLIPELCLLTGLTDAMRSNVTLMKQLSHHLHMPPMERVQALLDFMTRLKAVPGLVEELEGWGIHISSTLVNCKGRVLPKESILFAGGAETPSNQMDWTSAFRSQKLLVSSPLNDWSVIVTKRDSDGVENLVRVMQKVSAPLGFMIKRPKQVIPINDQKTQSYGRAVDELIRGSATGPEMVFIILANNSAETYAAVKKRLVVDHAIPSQCMLAKNLRAKGIMSIATKIVIQMCSKLGGEPWTLQVPFKNLMVIGIDTYGKATHQTVAIVASLSSRFTTYFSTSFIAHSAVDMISEYYIHVEKCLIAYQNKNGSLPDRIVVYRDGTVDGEANALMMAEVDQLKVLTRTLYKSPNDTAGSPKITYIIVAKKINTRLMADRGKGNVDNPPVGTIVDSTVTLPYRYDFFLVSASARQGTASPCSYSVVYDSSGLDADKLQRLTYKLTHLYFNWSGTVAVPAPVQYAHKLATLTASVYERPANENLAELLYYL